MAQLQNKGGNKMTNKYSVFKKEVVTKTYNFNGVIDEEEGGTDTIDADSHEKAVEIAKELESKESDNFELDQVNGTEVISTEYTAVQHPKEDK